MFEEAVERLIKWDKELIKKANAEMKFITPCNRCGYCCKDNKILVTLPEMYRLLKATGEKFFDIFEIEPNGFSVRVIDEDGYCKFYQEGMCKVYVFRPFQCRTYPVIFNIEFIKLPTYWRTERGYVYFRCESSEVNKARYRIRSKPLFDLIEERYRFLVENYKLQRTLIRENRLMEVLGNLVGSEVV